MDRKINRLKHFRHVSRLFASVISRRHGFCLNLKNRKKRKSCICNRHTPENEADPFNKCFFNLCKLFEYEKTRFCNLGIFKPIDCLIFIGSNRRFRHKIKYAEMLLACACICCYFAGSMRMFVAFVG